MSRRLSRRQVGGLGALSPRGKQVIIGVAAGAIASAAIYFAFFFAPTITKGKAGADEPQEG